LIVKSIDFYYDIISPFAHVILARLGEFPTHVTVNPKPVLLGALLNHWGQLGPAEIEPKRIHTYRLAAFLGQRHGLAMRFPPRHPFNSLGALRILAGAGADIAMVRCAFDFVFRDGGAPDTQAGLTEFAEAAGVPVSLATNENSKAVLRANTEEAIARGVFGVPTFAVAVQTGHELFWGVDAFDMLLTWLADEELFTREPYARLESVEVGIRRK
jgi:2-hydroxychromene-2-carboxylate isomerase